MKIRSCVILCILVIITISVAVLLQANSVSYEGTFKLSEYLLTEDEVLSDVKVLEITNADTAAQEANKVWMEMYGRKYQGRIVVRHDEENECWLVSASLPTLSLSDFPYFPAALILDDGTVLAVWLSQF